MVAESWREELLNLSFSSAIKVSPRTTTIPGFQVVEKDYQTKSLQEHHLSE
ncbi:unnamed protein product [Dovyalis caffra]|uniref:Uncharacterized protein n=1 Tax=Dovyalis caffra TaxID=77055 RepID=A0AAV1RAK3_9ROSI|nr:unnamed protein product [Dovyalis caffra]